MFITRSVGPIKDFADREVLYLRGGFVCIYMCEVLEFGSELGLGELGTGGLTMCWYMGLRAESGRVEG